MWKCCRWKWGPCGVPREAFQETQREEEVWSKDLFVAWDATQRSPLFPVSRLHRPTMRKPSLVFNPYTGPVSRYVVPLVQSMSLPHLAGLARSGPASAVLRSAVCLGPRGC